MAGAGRRERGEGMEDLKNPEVFAKYYKSVYQDMYRFALYTLRNPHDAEDVTGEAVADAYASIGKLRDPQAFRGWIFKILSNKCKRKLKEYADRTEELAGQLYVQECMEEGVQVRQAFFALSDEERLLIALKVFGGYKSYEIGAMMNMNDNTVRSKISRGLGKLRKLLK